MVNLKIVLIVVNGGVASVVSFVSKGRFILVEFVKRSIAQGIILRSIKPFPTMRRRYYNCLIVLIIIIVG